VLASPADRPRSDSDPYRNLAASLVSLLEGETDALANLANAGALLAESLDRINWCGFYILRGRELVPGHIACDPASRSEIVVPIVEGGVLRGVLDLDSPIAGRFDERDRAGLEAFVGLLRTRIRWSDLERPA
jgi:L-methionine (R)-S-oxide reductase